METIAISIISVLLGGGVTSIFINLNNKRREQYIFLIDKAERLFGHTSDFVLMFPEIERAFEELSAGWIDITEFDIKVGQIDLDNPGHRESSLIPIGTQAYVRLYFPNCAAAFDRCVFRSIEACSIATNLKSHYMYFKDMRKNEPVKRIDEFHERLGLSVELNSLDDFVKERREKFLELSRSARDELKNAESCVISTLDGLRLGWIGTFSRWTRI